MGELIIIGERENSGFVDTWTEYLCIEKVPEGFELSIRAHELLAEASEYVDEEGEELELPDEINGRSVLYSDGDFILGESLEIRLDSHCGEEGVASIKFKDVKEKKIKEFLQCFKWYNESILSEIKVATK